MKPHRLVTINKADEKIRLFIVVVAMVVGAVFLVRLPFEQSGSAQVLKQDKPGSCTGTFAGEWSDREGSRLTISLQGDEAEGFGSIPQIKSFNFKGKIKNYNFKDKVISNSLLGGFRILFGSWTGESEGDFSAMLDPDRHRIEFSFPPWILTGGNHGTITFPSIVPIGFNKSHDADNFKTFDALPKVEQEKLLAERGPRLPLQYTVSDLSMRAFVKGGWPVVLDYGLDSDASGELSIGVEGAEPLVVNIDPAKRAQVKVVLPESFGTRPQVGKLHLVALTKVGTPAKFFLYGFAMGARGVQAFMKVSGPGSGAELAMISSSPKTAPGYDERIPLFALRNPQESWSIKVAAPTRIKPKQKPKQLVRFSFTFHSSFNGGRWELWHDSGLDLTKVWENTIRGIVPNKTARGQWDGIISFQKKVLVGNYVLQLNAWRGLESEADWALSRTSNVIAIEAP